MKRLTFPWMSASVAAVTIAVYIVLERGLSRPLTVAVLRQDGAVTAWDHLHPWTLVWAIFLHLSQAHVLTNMAVLVLVGTFLEQEISGWIWLFAYFASGIVGNLAQSLRLPPHDLAAGAAVPSWDSWRCSRWYGFAAETGRVWRFCSCWQDWSLRVNSRLRRISL